MTAAIKELPSVLWRAIRSSYYKPGQFATHLVRLARNRTDDWYRITAPWIVNSGYPVTDKTPRPSEWYKFRHKFTFVDEHVRFDLDYAMQTGDVKGLALIFFMGMGDYFFATPLIQSLKEKYPDLPIIGFASKNGGNVNSPMMAELLAADPNINEVRSYDGKQTRRYKNYDYTDALRQVPANYLAIPVLYEHLPRTTHRLASLYETFGLEMPRMAPLPLLHLPASPPPHVTLLLEKIKQQVAKQGLKGIAFLQMDSRSSHYVYPQADALAEGLGQRGYFVVSASKLSRAYPFAHQLNFKEFAIMDSVYLLKLLRDNFENVRIVSVASVFWSVSAGFGIPNLGMQQFPDDAMHNFWYPNITVITHHDYPRLPPPCRFLAREDDYTLIEQGKAIFKPDFVLNCFDKTLAAPDTDQAIDRKAAS